MTTAYWKSEKHRKSFIRNISKYCLELHFIKSCILTTNKFVYKYGKVGIRYCSLLITYELTEFWYWSAPQYVLTCNSYSRLFSAHRKTWLCYQCSVCLLHWWTTQNGLIISTYEMLQSSGITAVIIIIITIILLQVQIDSCKEQSANSPNICHAGQYIIITQHTRFSTVI